VSQLPDPADLDDAPASRLRVLIVEDHLEVATSTALLLQLFGHDVVVAYDGPTGLEAARLREPDVAILDIGLPRMDGCEVARRLVELCKEKKPFLIAVSGYGGAEQVRRGAEAGIDLHLLKPADPEVIRHLLERFHRIIA
jgi:two-component system, OmpR family, response regulator